MNTAAEIEAYLQSGYAGPPEGVGIAFAIAKINKHFASIKPRPVPIGDVALLIIRDLESQMGVEIPVLVKIMDYRDGEVTLGNAAVCDDVPPYFSAEEIVTLTPMEQERAQNLWAFSEDKTEDEMQEDAIRNQGDNL